MLRLTDPENDSIEVVHNGHSYECRNCNFHTITAERMIVHLRGHAVKGDYFHPAIFSKLEVYQRNEKHVTP